MSLFSSCIGNILGKLVYLRAALHNQYDCVTRGGKKGKNVYPHAHMQQLMPIAFASLIMNDKNKVVMYIENIH